MNINQITKHILLPLLIFLPGWLMAQTGILQGKVSDDRGLPVVGATVSEVRTNQTTLTDLFGNFQMALPEAGGYSITISAVGYRPMKITDINVHANIVDTLEIALSNSAVELENVVVALPQKASSINSMIRYQKNTAGVAQVLSGEAISRSPDNNTADALKRVTGLSLQEGKYINVRGLGNRYNQAMLNGVLLSSTEPDRKTFSFDLFPASIVENIVIHKTFLPEYPGEWAGGLIQINTKSIPARDFLEVQLGTGLNTETINREFYKAPGGNLDWLGFDDGSRALPENFPGKNAFAGLSDAEKTEWGKRVAGGNWSSGQYGGLSTLGQSVRLNGGFAGELAGKKAGGMVSVNYSRGLHNLGYDNRFFNINAGKADASFDYHNRKYATHVALGAMGNFSLQFNKDHQFYFRNQFNTSTTIHTTMRTGKDFEANAVSGENIRAVEHGFKSNVLFNTQIGGTNRFRKMQAEVAWFGSFGILDQYIPNQRRLQYNQTESPGKENWQALISNTLSQKTGSVFYAHLNDYLYNAGANLKKEFSIGAKKQSFKTGYLLQVKDRIYNARPFAISLSGDNTKLKEEGPETIFLPEHFGSNRGFEFDEISGIYYRYIANSYLNAAYLQFENKIGNALEITWGARYEHFDQVVGSKDPSDQRYTHSITGDILPGINMTWKLNRKTNLRVAAAQTVIRPEFRELTGMAFYDFELGATVVGNPNLERTRVSHLDLRFEKYPAAGELFTAGLFYKYFDNPIELAFNQSGAGSSSTFNYPDNHFSFARTYGAEVEIRKRLNFMPILQNFVFHGNVSYLFNKVHFLSGAADRPMQGQSPYLVNAGLEYLSEENGWSGSLLFNQFGRRILYVGNEVVPAVWEAPRPLLDIQISREVMQGQGRVTLNVTDLLNRPARYYHDLNEDKVYSKQDALVLQRNYGTGISISFNYKIK